MFLKRLIFACEIQVQRLNVGPDFGVVRKAIGHKRGGKEVPRIVAVPI